MEPAPVATLDTKSIRLPVMWTPSLQDQLMLPAILIAISGLEINVNNAPKEPILMPREFVSLLITNVILGMPKMDCASAVSQATILSTEHVCTLLPTPLPQLTRVAKLQTREFVSNVLLDGSLMPKESALQSMTCAVLTTTTASV